MYCSLGAVIGMVHQLGIGFGAASPDRHIQRIDDEFAAEMIRNRPSHHPPRPGVDDDRQIHLAFFSGMLGDISNPQPVRFSNGESAVNQIIRRDRLRVTAGATTPATPINAFYAGLPHQPFHPLPPHLDVLT